ncbi:MAG: tetratricopeptide repeat protein, partial [Luteimonas sp.]
AEPTAKDVLDASAASVSETLADAPQLRARMQMMLARAYNSLGDADKASILLDASIAGFLSKPVNRLDQAAKAMAQLADVETEREHRNRAVELARGSLALLQQTNAPPGELLEAASILEGALMSVARFSEAERSLEFNRPLIAKVFGDPSLQLADSLNNQAELASNAGELRKSERLFRSALAMKARIKASPQALFASRGLLGVALRRQGRFDEAERLLLENRGLAPKLYPKDPGRIANLENRLATVYRDEGDLVRAQAGYEHAIALETHASGLRTLETALVMANLAGVLEARGDLRGAENTYRSVEDMVRAAPAASDIAELRAAANFGVFLSKQGGKAPTGDRVESVLARWIRLYSPEGRSMPWDLAEARFLQVEYLIATARYDAAERALPAFDPDPDQPLQQARRAYLLAQIATARGQSDAAAKNIASALRISDAVAGTSSAYGALWRLDQAQLFLASGKRDLARQQLAIAEPVLRRQMIAGSKPIARMEHALREAAPR